jgi:3,4-dihydroxy 2-butanone 4-phosphate synthase / GTP cyclohydrolase II
MIGENNPKKNITVSIDFKFTTTGISVFERADTIKAVMGKNSRAEDFKSPGHVFPLIVAENGILDYLSSPKATVDLARMCPDSSEIS